MPGNDTGQQTLRKPPLESSQELRVQIASEKKKKNRREKSLVVAQRNILKEEKRALNN